MPCVGPRARAARAPAPSSPAPRPRSRRAQTISITPILERKVRDDRCTALKPYGDPRQTQSRTTHTTPVTPEGSCPPRVRALILPLRSRAHPHTSHAADPGRPTTAVHVVCWYCTCRDPGCSKDSGANTLGRGAHTVPSVVRPRHRTASAQSSTRHRAVSQAMRLRTGFRRPAPSA